MKQNFKSHRSITIRLASDLIPVAGLIASAIGLILISTKFIDQAGAIIAAASVLISIVLGSTSLYTARIAKRLIVHRRIFISYSYENKETAEKLSKSLEDQGAVVWMDTNAIRPGDDLHSSINAAIESSNTVIALFPEKMSDHISKEIRSAIERRVPVLAVLDPTSKTPELLDNGNISIIRSKDIKSIVDKALLYSARSFSIV